MIDKWLPVLVALILSAGGVSATAPAVRTSPSVRRLRTMTWPPSESAHSAAARSGGSNRTSQFGRASSSRATPTNVTENDPNAVDLGVKFQASTNGTIIGIRFYKGPQNTGTHTGDLWTTSGTLLASATFTNETASGWQQVFSKMAS